MDIKIQNQNKVASKQKNSDALRRQRFIVCTDDKQRKELVIGHVRDVNVPKQADLAVFFDAVKLLCKQATKRLKRTRLVKST